MRTFTFFVTFFLPQNVCFQKLSDIVITEKKTQKIFAVFSLEERRVQTFTCFTIFYRKMYFFTTFFELTNICSILFGRGEGADGTGRLSPGIVNYLSI